MNKQAHVVVGGGNRRVEVVDNGDGTEIRKVYLMNKLHSVTVRNTKPCSVTFHRDLVGLASRSGRVSDLVDSFDQFGDAR